MNISGKTILLVEDETIIALNEKMSLEKYGYTVITINSGEKAIEEIEKNTNIDIILMDIDLGAGIDGPETAMAIHKDRDIPIIFLSNHTEPEIVEKTEMITSYGYVVKNAGITVLDASIKMALKLYNAKNEIEGFFTANLDLLCIADMDTNFIKVNKEWETVLGYSAKELQQRKFIDFVHPDDRQETLKSVATLGNQNNVLNFVNRYLCKDGTYRYIEWRSHPRGNLIYAAARDITERKQSEEELSASKEKFKAFFTNAQVALFRTGISDGKLIEINKRYAEIAGYSNIEDCLAEFNAAAAWVDPGSRIELQRILKENNYVTDFEAEIIRRDGVHIWILFSATIFSKSGTIEGSLVDITERKQAEEVLKESEMKYRALIESSSDAIFCVTEKGEYKFTNQLFASTFGKNTEYFIGKTFWDVYDKEHADHRYEATKRLFQTGISEAFEVEVPLPDKTLYFLAKTNPIKDKSGKVILNLTYASDITAQKQTEMEIKRQLSEKETLLKEVHHRIKNNISSIEGLLSLQANSTDNTDVKTALQEALSRVQSIRILYDNLLINEEYQEVSVKKYSEGLIDSLSAVFPVNKSIIIEKNISDFTLKSKIMILVGIIINELMTNIFKYAFKGRTAGVVLINFYKEDSHVTLTIHDNGIGFTDRANLNKSPGFGLTIVKMLAEQLNGVFTIENDNGTKSVLNFEI